MNDRPLTAKELLILRTIHGMAGTGRDSDIRVNPDRSWTLHPADADVVVSSSKKFCDLANRGYLTLNYAFHDRCEVALTNRGRTAVVPSETLISADYRQNPADHQPSMMALVCLLLRRLPGNRFEFDQIELDTLDPRDMLASFPSTLSGTIVVEYRPYNPPEADRG